MSSFFHPSNYCQCVRFSRDGKYLGTAGSGIACIFNVKTGHQIAALKTDTVYVTELCFAADNRSVAVAGLGPEILLCNIVTEAVEKEYVLSHGSVTCLDISHVTNMLAAGSSEGCVEIWNLQSSHRLQSISMCSPVKSLAYSARGDLLAMGFEDRIVRVWDVISEMTVGVFCGHDDIVFSVVFSANGQAIISSALDKTVKVWEFIKPTPSISATPTSSCKHTFYKCGRRAEPSPDGEWIACGRENQVVFHDSDSGESTCMLFDRYGGRNGIGICQL